MRDDDKKAKLVRFLDEKAFDPVLRASPDDYGENEAKRKLEDVQRSTRSEKHRYHERYSSAEEVRDQFLSDLSSQPAKRIHEELESLDLPRLPQLREEFLQLCDSLDVGPRS